MLSPMRAMLARIVEDDELPPGEASTPTRAEKRPLLPLLAL